MDAIDRGVGIGVVFWSGRNFHPCGGPHGTCLNVNQYLKWGFVQAATCAIRIKAYRGTHLDLLYHRLAPAKGHGRAIVAVARHLAEASYWVLRKRQPYKAPAPRTITA
jgi:hypothetical protein